MFFVPIHSFHLLRPRGFVMPCSIVLHRQLFTLLYFTASLCANYSPPNNPLFTLSRECIYAESMSLVQSPFLTPRQPSLTMSSQRVWRHPGNNPPTTIFDAFSAMQTYKSHASYSPLNAQDRDKHGDRFHILALAITESQRGWPGLPRMPDLIACSKYCIYRFRSQLRAYLSHGEYQDWVRASRTSDDDKADVIDYARSYAVQEKGREVLDALGSAYPDKGADGEWGPQRLGSIAASRSGSTSESRRGSSRRSSSFSSLFG
ncbi:hypothetical protein BDY17DRAFT_303036 [Neohortaea acidophila]|uniref:Uncharacterized protein n=1 Tax=Neohortaea acidophila TaxID=245834 RepID=A0A6A6PL50_9PEZI|nr:uncharacterized protein BDY17DRAFT_303036 [Neohortaea acidophila]KAF2479997.1 hypothetical protein BDY17DRAFT_303036 [Neohortaea acidophila]